MTVSMRLMAAVTTGALLVPAGISAAAEDPADAGAASRSGETRRERLAQIALPAGLQVESKHTSRPRVRVGGKSYPAANPHLALVPDPSRVDYSYWQRQAARKAREGRDAGRSGAGQKPPTPFVFEEREPAGTSGSNDAQAVAERIERFGTSSGKRAAVRVLGNLVVPNVAGDQIPAPEDQGSIPLAIDTRIPDDRSAVRVSGRIGNGPHGSERSGSGDFDFFKVGAGAGETIAADTFGSTMDTVLVVYDAAGEILAANDDAGGTLQSQVSSIAPTDGAYYVMVGGFPTLPEDPFDSGSGFGAGEEGDYEFSLSVFRGDVDYYAVRLKKGDVLGGSIDGGATDLRVHRYDGRPRVSSTFDISSFYPVDSPLPGGGSAVVAYVAERTGWYAVSTGAGAGAYRLLLEVYRPGTETAGRKIKQKVFLDFDGERLNTGIFGGRGVTTLSPLRSFLARWGLARTDLDAVIDQTVATVKENIRNDLREQGLNGKVRVKVRNSRDHRDRFGDPNVSRVIVGGTIEQSGVFTIGIAESIDPGNFGHEETGLVLLDILSDPDTSFEPSLNAYLTPASNRIRFVGTAVGNVVSHEIGHFVGSYHVDQFNDTLNLMDQGGNFPLLYGVGPDGTGGTADDPDVDFGIDVFNPNEGFGGLENTLNNTAWAFVLGR